MARGAVRLSGSIRDLDSRVAPIARAFVRHLVAHGIRVTVTSTRRSMDEQRSLYSNYKRCGCSSCPPRAGRCYPAAAPGQSTHGAGLAFDLRLEPPVYSAVGRLWEMLGFTWGGRFDDPIHFDFRPR